MLYYNCMCFVASHAKLSRRKYRCSIFTCITLFNADYRARRYASAVYAVVVCMSVRPSVCLFVCHRPALYQYG